MERTALAATAALALAALASHAGRTLAKEDDEVARYLAYREVVAKTAALVADGDAQRLAQQHGLNVMNVTWEDTGRYKGSSVGPNISDVTIQVQQMDPRTERCDLTCMPVIRFPNFSDRSADLSPEAFSLLVGNEKGGGELRCVTLAAYLDDLRAHLTQPDSWKGKGRSLLAPRDSHVLVSAQACFLPVPKGQKAEFNPVIFNYTSFAGDPAVLCILATREGTSATIIDNQRDGFAAGRTWGQRLFFNQQGERASLTGQRKSDFEREREADPAPRPAPAASAAGEQGLNMVLLIQVPLKQKNPMRGGTSLCDPECDGMVEEGCERKGGSDVEEAVIGHGRVEGVFTEVDGVEIERDPRFPIRVTVQFYKATSNGVVAAADLAEIAAQIERVYAQADYVGSLVTAGTTRRPTEYEGPKDEPPGWWAAFWQRHEANTGQDRAAAIAMLGRLYGSGWKRFSRDEERLAGALAWAREQAQAGQK